MTTCYQKGNWEVNINEKHPLEEGIKLREDVNLLSQNEETTLLSPKRGDDEEVNPLNYLENGRYAKG